MITPAKRESSSNQIATFWFEGPLRRVDKICLQSMVANRLDVNLYTFGEIPNVPTGVKIHDASKILDGALRSRLFATVKKEYNHWLPTVQFSDLFRIMLLKNGAGLWLDTDVLIFKPFEFDRNQVFFAKEDKHRIGASVFYLPQHHAIIHEYERLLEQEKWIPNWLGFVRGKLKPLWYHITQSEWSPSDLGVTMYGNDAFTRLTKRHKEYKHALPKSTFYAWAANENFNIYKTVNFRDFFTDPLRIGLHIHRKALADQKPEPESLWDWAIKTYDDS